MEDGKLAAYYDELTRKGSGAARFKQGLGFSSSDDGGVPSRGSATTSSFLNNFVKASSPSKSSEFEKQAQLKSSEFEKQAQLQSIQNKLSKKPKDEVRSRSHSRDTHTGNSSRRSRSGSPIRDSNRDRHSRRRSRSRSRERYTRRRSRSRSRERYTRRRSRSRSRDSYASRRNRSRSRSRDRYSKHRSTSLDRRAWSRNRERNRKRSERRSRSGSPEKGKSRGVVRNDGRKGVGIDYAKLIDGYDRMTPAERVKATMKLQLSRTAENDETIGKGSGWERFDFNMDAPLDDEEIEAAKDDAMLVKHMGQSFHFSAVEKKKEEEMKAAHDEAMFGAASFPPPADTEDETEEERLHAENVETAPVRSLLSDQVLTMQQGSWRDRARKT